MRNVFFFSSLCTVFLFVLTSIGAAETQSLAVQYEIDPVSRYVHVACDVPKDAPETVVAKLEISLDEGKAWQPGHVQPLLSDTARNFYPADLWDRAYSKGETVEEYAPGTTRTLVWNPFEQVEGDRDVAVRVTLAESDGTAVASGQTTVELRNADVVIIDDWTAVLQAGAVSGDPKPGEKSWWFRKDQQGPLAPSSGTSLDVKEKGVALPQITCPLDLKGTYAVFVSMPPKTRSIIELRLSGDLRCQCFGNDAASLHGDFIRPGHEAFWRWTPMDCQHLVVKQSYRTIHEYEDDYRSRLDRVRFVPLPEETVASLDARWAHDEKRWVYAGYNEPYSWAFFENVQTSLQHAEPLLAFAEAGVDIVDTQLGRGGMRKVYETRKGDRLIQQTHGDPIRGKTPETGNVGRMQQYTNMFATQNKIVSLLGGNFFANFGMTNCYPGSSLEARFSKTHPEWRSGSFLKYDVPEVRAHVLAFYEEVLELGATRLSFDMCRYSNAVKKSETVTGFLRELRALADKHTKPGQARIPILARFPAHGANRAEFMDYKTWIAEGLVDYLCPSWNQDNRDQFGFDVAPYVKATRGTEVRVLPDIYNAPALLPGFTYQRVLGLRDEGVDGVYYYQADAPILGSAETRRFMSLLGSPAALDRWNRAEDAKQDQYSRRIYRHMVGKTTCFWIEGFRPKSVEIWYDGKRFKQFAGGPYCVDLPGSGVVELRIDLGERRIVKEW